MFRKILVSTVTATAIAAGSLGAMTSTAAAGGKHHGNFGIYIGGPNYGVQWGHYQPAYKKVCHPIFKKKKVWTHYGWEWKKVKVGYDCDYVPIY